MAPSRTRRTLRPLAATRALREFLSAEAAGGLALIAATIAALIWANSPWGDTYEELWHTAAKLGIGTWSLELDLRHWVNDGLMALFFFVVALEVKRELRVGELKEPRRAALPVVGAVGGMVVPALIYLAFNGGGDAASGWGIPMATDIAFAVGVLAVVAPRLPSSLRLFLLTLAIVDDIGAIVVIAVFYSADIDFGAMFVAVAAIAVLVAARALRLFRLPAVLPLAVVLWLAVHEAGIHATLAGVVLGLLVPVVQLERLEHVLHPWSSYLVVPVFALSNAGVQLSGDAITGAVASSVTLGVVGGLVLGKTVGIAGAAWLATRTGVAELPGDATWRQVIGVAALGGIGFTVSLFITTLAFDNDSFIADAKVGILAASLLATIAGSLVLRQRRELAG